MFSCGLMVVVMVSSKSPLGHSFSVSLVRLSSYLLASTAVPLMATESSAMSERPSSSMTGQSPATRGWGKSKGALHLPSSRLRSRAASHFHPQATNTKAYVRLEHDVQCYGT